MSSAGYVATIGMRFTIVVSSFQPPAATRKGLLLTRESAQVLDSPSGHICRKGSNRLCKAGKENREFTLYGSQLRKSRIVEPSEGLL
jgi:hypothetical protein